MRVGAIGPDREQEFADEGDDIGRRIIGIQEEERVTDDVDSGGEIKRVHMRSCTTIRIIRCKRPHNQKIAALTFILLPLINYAMAGGTFGNASQYGMILVSLIIMYCIIDDVNAYAAGVPQFDDITMVVLSIKE